MKLNLLLTSKLALTLTCWMLINHSGWSQIMAMAQTNHQSERTTQVEHSLKDVLNELKDIYKVDIMYERTVIEGLTVSDNAAINAQKLEKNLEKILNPFGLRYKKVNRSSYLILAEKPAKKLGNIEQPAPDPEFIPQPNQYLAGDVSRLSNQLREVKRIDHLISGKVIDDENGEGLPGATILIKGTSRGTTTDINGNFTLSVPDDNTVLEVSYIGYLNVELAVGTQSQFTIILKSDAKALSEVVVVGYGTQKKINLTGAISTVSAKDIASRPVSSTQQSLQGLVPNLNISVSNAGGEPGASYDMSIRGLQSFGGSNAPYVLVDNIVMDINSINPNDIESITVLKDAASSAIYGARAAYGVILITTKTGKSNKGRANVSYSTNLAISKPVQVPKLVDAMTFALVANDAAKNIGNSPWYSAEALDRLAKNIANPGSAPEMLGQANGLNWNIGSMGLGAAANTDWYKILYKDYSSRQKHDLSVSGSSEKMDYYLSAGWYGEQGLLRYGEESFNRYNFDGKINAQATSWAKIGLLFKYNYGLQEFPWQQDLGRGRIYDMMSKLKPTMPAKYPGSDIWTQESRIDEWRTQRDNTTNTQMVLAPRVILEPIKGWVTNLEFNYTASNNREVFSAKQYFWLRPNGELADGLSKVATSYRPRLFTDTYLSPNLYSTYTRSFGKNNFSALVGYQQEKYDYFGLNADALYLLSDNVPSINTAVGTKTVSDGQGYWSTQSGFGRINYNYDEKYLIEANFRADGSSRFQPGKQWGYFPSVSAGWVPSKEKFYPFKNLIDFFKLRGSFGELGNQNVANYLYIPTLGINQSTFLFSGQRLWTVTAPNISSINLTWEKVKTLDFGADLTFLGNRLATTFDWYESRTTNLVGPGPALPAVLGTQVPRENSGEIRTRGFELELSWKNNIGDFYYQIGANLANNKSKVMSYNNPTRILSTYYEGQTLGELWGYKTDGLFQSTDEVANWPSQSFLWAGKWNPGDLKYQDLDKNGKVNNGTNTADDHGDMVVVGNQLPQYLYGFNASAAWKGFDFSVFFQGVGKQDLYISEIFNGNIFRGPANGPFHMMVYPEHLDYWRDATSALGANPNAYYAKPYSVFDGDNSKAHGRPTDRYLQNGAYMRLKNLRVGYTIPEKLSNKVLVKRANIYFSGENLFIMKNMDLLDPEQTGGRNGDGRTYPLSKSFSLGLNINF
ncbi:MAG: TonB-dependent receptor [Saprospiraceae bacterium]|nr:TonB-dependent receptor [Saprospiraceae bacterium]